MTFSYELRAGVARMLVISKRPQHSWMHPFGHGSDAEFSRKISTQADVEEVLDAPYPRQLVADDLPAGG
jgi:hypothetical protein